MDICSAFVTKRKNYIKWRVTDGREVNCGIWSGRKAKALLSMKKYNSVRQCTHCFHSDWFNAALRPHKPYDLLGVVGKKGRCVLGGGGGGVTNESSGPLPCSHTSELFLLPFIHSFFFKCCSTFTETMRTDYQGREAQADVHLDFHTAPEFCLLPFILLLLQM